MVGKGKLATRVSLQLSKDEGLIHSFWAETSETFVIGLVLVIFCLLLLDFVVFTYSTSF